MTSKVTYVGHLRCESTHLQSNTTIFTDAPTDNHGKGEAFSPTDLCATSVAQCVLTTVAILGEPRGIDIKGATCGVQKVMYADPRRIGEIICHFKFPQDFSEKDQKFIEAAAKTCPVSLSLHPDVKKIFTYEYGVL